MVALMTGFQTGQLPPLHVEGMNLKDPSGKTVVLKGTNVGNWFVTERWMWGLPEGSGEFADQYELETILSDRFGEAEKNRLMEVYRSNWIQEKDFATIRSFGFNAIRVPMNYRQFEDDRHPFQLRPNAFKWTDRAVEWAGKHGLYVILDMHGIQGGQSPYDHTGRVDQNKFWTDETAKKRWIWLWKELAKHYRSNGTVAAYDLYNEPYGGTHEKEKEVFAQIVPAVRAVDPEKLIYAMGHYDTFTQYGSPKENGWHNVGYQMHYYPGLFGNGDPTLMTWARFYQTLPEVQEQVKAFGGPFLVGEMNVVFDQAGDGAMMRKAFDTFASYGWSTTMWSYKVLTADGGHGDGSWGMVTNSQPMKKLDVRKDSKAEIEAWFKSLSTIPVEKNQGLYEAMTAKVAPIVELPELPPVRTTAPADETLPGWTSFDVGGSRVGGLKRLDGGGFELYGGGSDIWGGQDQFRFVAKKVTGDFEIEATLDSVEDLANYVKAGLMARATTGKDSPMVMVTSFPSGGLQTGWRSSAGGTVVGTDDSLKASVKGLTLRLTRRGDRFASAYREAGGEFKELHSETVALSKTVWVGAVACSHDNRRLVKVVYRSLAVK